MIKVCVSGKAGSGKDTFTNLLIGEVEYCGSNYVSTFFAKKIKETVMEWFPGCDSDSLYGNSELRQQNIKTKLPFFKEEVSFREACLEFGKVGRAFSPTFWISHVALEFYKAKEDGLDFFITDQRFPDEFTWAKNEGFLTIRVKRDNHLKLTDISETSQAEVSDDSYDVIIDNNGTIEDLEREAKRVAKMLI